MRAISGFVSGISDSAIQSAFFRSDRSFSLVALYSTNAEKLQQRCLLFVRILAMRLSKGVGLTADRKSIQKSLADTTFKVVKLTGGTEAEMFQPGEKVFVSWGGTDLLVFAD
ncbi:hypothetical protein K1W69_09020 [Hoeflea sp. WL0058]|uniref:Uncharacterized protein n=1 Tax=Flavimaribacter sediminis TaxID=2865987 RepID=A0AAE3D182_9HYPH|nr:hypothetical protein [Flavimaribacter sediminis]MBW8637328.1 hypothetical protein [Flavimaribacter sediminis]